MLIFYFLPWCSDVLNCMLCVLFLPKHWRNDIFFSCSISNLSESPPETIGLKLKLLATWSSDWIDEILVGSKKHILILSFKCLRESSEVLSINSSRLIDKWFCLKYFCHCEQKRQYNYMCCLCVGNKYMVVKRQQTLKEVTWFVTDLMYSSYLCSGLWIAKVETPVFLTNLVLYNHL